MAVAGLPGSWVVAQFAKPLATKAAKVHEGKPCT
jgi:hypothetical protein